MALTIVDSGSLVPVTGPNVATSVAAGTTPQVYVAVFDLSTQAGCIYAVTWASQVPGSPNMAQIYRSADITVTAGVIDGFAAPPVPINYSADLNIDLVSGTPATPVYWAVYQLT